MIRALRSLCLLILLCAPLFAFAASDPVYTALRAARPDARTITLTNFTFVQDVFKFTLNGKLVLLQQVEGKTPGAVFLGQGSYEFKPVSAAELRQVQINAGDDRLEVVGDQFDSAVFLGSALVAAAEKAGAPVAGAADPVAAQRWDEYLKKQKKSFRANFHIRVLQEMLNNETTPYFFVWVNGKKYPPAILQVDALDDKGEPASMAVDHEQKGGMWYSSRLKGTAWQKPKPLADADNYVIDATIKGAELSATTTMTFTANSAIRVLPLNLTRNLRVSDASWSIAGDTPEWQPLPFIQEDKDEDGDAAVIFPTALVPNGMYMVKMTYAGKEVLVNAGDGNFSVGARVSWYPNVAVFDDVADYELRFRTPQKMQVVAVGNEVENKVEGDERVSVWKTDTPFRVAGFNYGKFKKLSESDTDSGMSIEVYTNPGTPDILKQINSYLEAVSQQEGGPGFIRVDTSKLAQSALADGINTARIGNHYFGPLSHKKVAITQQSEWNFGQSWPSLIYMPYMAFLTGTQRNILGMGTGVKDFVDNVGPHEFAHQWWGHEIGWATYRDQWLSEGFAEFTAAMVVQTTAGWPRYNAFWEDARKWILTKPRGATISNDQAGPISQGYRVSTWQTPAAYQAMTYSKGAYVLHMLRMAMHDRTNGDAAFTAMMKDFAKTYSGRNPSTADFQRIVEKHATPNLKSVTTDGKLDWFFDEWVHGTTIPKYESSFDVQDAGGGKFKIKGSITQSGVPDTFAMPVPLYVHFDKNSYSKLGSVVIVGNASKPIEIEVPMPKKPMKLSINANHDVLSR
ncbi:MAG TPA: M1 family aminopeptidase [Thermoanaerobaculia bacterium]|nr:M1 family aminopeptidase [Thermoanaerobaculia bacterium]